MWATSIGKYLRTAVLIGLLGGCVPLQPYHTARLAAGGSAAPSASPAPATPCYRPPPDQRDSACVRFVEYDDFGNLFNRAQLDETVAAARAVAERHGIVVVYVHGWEHNAAPGDADLEVFHRAMQNAQILDRKQYLDKREVLGIYIGWRGQSVSLPGVSKLTFWERKSTAQSVGDGAVFELLRKLANHREWFPRSRLVVIGHSFGAAVTYSSVSHSVMDQIIDDPYDPGRPKGIPARDRSKRWDLVVLVNPAFEAMQLRPHFDLGRSRSYQPDQLPHLVVITSQADWATRIAFPAGRYLRSTLNKYADPDSPDLYRTAIGHYLPFVTHQLTVEKDCAPFRNAPKESRSADKLGAVVEDKYVCFDDKRAFLNDGSISATPKVLLTRCDGPGDCAKVAGDHRMQAPPYMPILNIRTTSDVMAGHNDIWNPIMQGFLVQLMLRVVEPPEGARPAEPAAAQK